MFYKNTFISHKWNVHEFNTKRLEALDIEYQDCLTKEELENLIYSFYTYTGTQNKHKILFEKILFGINK
jgi:hypothetical protein